MTNISISVSDDRLARLRDLAARRNVSPEELVRLGVEGLLSRPDDAFERAADYVLGKNAELYRRLHREQCDRADS